MRLAAIALLAAAACGGSDSKQTDSPAGVSVQAVSCPATPAATITVNTAGSSYMPNTASIPVGGVVKFMITATHDVSSSTSGLHVDFGATACLMFPAAGTFNFHCSVHGFTGSVTVQ